MVERILDDYDMAYGLRHVALRYFNAAGADPDGEIGEARDVETHLVPLALDAILGRRPPLQVFGDDYPTPDGTAMRDYIHVSDLAEAHVRALDLLLGGRAVAQAQPRHRPRLLGARRCSTPPRAVAGRPVPHAIAPRRPGDPPALVADPRAAFALLGQDLTARSGLDSIVETAWAWQSRARPYA